MARHHRFKGFRMAVSMYWLIYNATFILRRLCSNFIITRDIIHTRCTIWGLRSLRFSASGPQIGHVRAGRKEVGTKSSERPIWGSGRSLSLFVSSTLVHYHVLSCCWVVENFRICLLFQLLEKYCNCQLNRLHKWKCRDFRIAYHK